MIPAVHVYLKGNESYSLNWESAPFPEECTGEEPHQEKTFEDLRSGDG